MLDAFLKVYGLLERRERRNAAFLLGLMVLMGLAEAVGVASIMPFIAVVSNPDVVGESRYLSWLYRTLGFESTDAFLVFLGLLVFALIVSSLAVKAVTHWAMARFANMRGYSLSKRLFEAYLSKPYSYHLGRHSADLSKAVLAEVQLVIQKSVIPLGNIIASAVVALFLVALIVVVDPWIAFSAALILGGAYAAVYRLLRSYLARIGRDRFLANGERFQVVQEAFGGIKEVKLLGKEQRYVQVFRGPALRFARHQSANQIISELPQFFLQAIAFGGILTILLVLLGGRDGGLSSALPLLALYAFAAYRLMPALQKMYQAVATLRFSKPALESLHQDLVSLRASGDDLAAADSAPDSNVTAPLKLRDSIELRGVEYTYPGADRPALRGVSCTIRANSTVGFVGSTGSGKTTVVDVVLGLLEPEKGQLVVDGVPIGPCLSERWQRSVGYVPQSIFLTDDSIAANIAFGVEPSAIDWVGVEKAARAAALHEFVMQHLPEGYDTVIGERGTRLSGGQQQRIGIARALYHDPDVLVLDEATSALDSPTEQAVMDAVRTLGGTKTIILVAHRITTVRHCDTIFLMSSGRISACGAYDDLLNKSESFRRLAAP